ncbi:MAG: PPC domain-containing protein, partial [Planctomycetales bacterium]|nr:PPC domain-containing protein [Planctomycetales bacterium]
QFQSDSGSGSSVGSANPVWLETSDLPEHLEAEPNNDATSAPIVDGSAVLNGRIEVPGDVDVWRFTAAKGERFEFEVRAARLGSPLDAVIEIRDTAGKSLANADDIAGGQTDARLSFTAPSDGEFTVTVRDQFDSRGDARFAYRMYLRRSDRIEPSFTLTLPADALTVNRGGEAKLKMTSERLHGFAGAIRLTAQGLPEGVTAEEVEIADKKSDATMVFKAAADARVDQHRLTIVGHAEWEDRQLETTATNAATTLGDPAMDRLWLAVAMPTPFQVIGDFETKYAARGSTYVRHFRLERGDYAGPLTVRLAERQVRHLQGISGPTISVPADASEFDYPIHLPPWMEIGRTSRTCVMAVGTVKDEQGRDHTVSYTSHAQNDQIIVLVDPGQLAVRLQRTSILAAPGDQVLLPIQVERGQELAGPVRVELLVPPHIAGLTSPTIELASGESAAQLSLTFDARKCGPFNQPLIVRATGSRDGLPYTAEAELEIVD